MIIDKYVIIDIFYLFSGCLAGLLCSFLLLVLPFWDDFFFLVLCLGFFLFIFLYLL